MNDSNKKAVEKAFEVTNNAYAPYSSFKVGACLKMKDGSYIVGANIENASYGLTNCAERSALFTAYSNGYTKDDIECLAVVTHTDHLVSPCGACRQVIKELMNEDTPIILSSDKEEVTTNISELLPLSFSSKDL